MDNIAQIAHLAAAHENSDFVFIFTPIHTVGDEEQNVVLHAVNQDQANCVSQVLDTEGLRFVCLFVFFRECTDKCTCAQGPKKCCRRLQNKSLGKTPGSLAIPPPYSLSLPLLPLFGNIMKLQYNQNAWICVLLMSFTRHGYVPFKKTKI